MCVDGGGWLELHLESRFLGPGLKGKWSLGNGPPHEADISPVNGAALLVQGRFPLGIFKHVHCCVLCLGNVGAIYTMLRISRFQPPNRLHHLFDDQLLNVNPFWNSDNTHHIDWNIYSQMYSVNTLYCTSSS